MKYQIIEREEPNILEELVNRAIQDGWEPLGGIGLSRAFAGNMFAQALVKRDLKTTKKSCTKD